MADFPPSSPTLAGDDATQRDHATTNLRDAEARQAFLFELGDALRLLADSEQIQATATRVLGRRLAANRVAYFEVNGADYVVRRDYTDGVRGLAGSYPVEAFGEHLPAVYRSGQTARSRDVATDPALSPADRASHLAVQIAAFVGVPLIKDGRFVGGLTVHMNQPRDWTAAEIAIIEETAERTWAAVERARAEELLRASEARLAAEAEALLNLNTVSSRLWQSRDLPGGLQEMLQATINMLGADMGNVQVVNSRGVLVIAAQRGFQQAFLDCFREVATDKDCACGRALRSGDRIMIADVDTDAPYAPFREVARAAGYRAVQSTPLLSRSGAPLGMISTHWRAPHNPNVHDLRRLDLYARQAADFIERSRNDEFMREGEARYRTLFDSIDEGFCVIEFLDGPQGPMSDYVHVQANPAYERHAGIPNVVGQKVRDMVPGEADGWVELYRNVLLTGQSIRFERELVATGRYLELAAFRVEPSSRRQVAVVFQDITARKKVENELRKSRERFDIVKDTTQVGFWFCDLPFDKLDWDNRVKEHFWLPPDAGVTIDTFYERMHPEDREPTRRAIEASIANKTSYETEYRTVSPAGQVKWIRAIGRGFYDGNGQPIRFDGVTLDITERKHAEEALRTAKERAEAASRSKDDFLAVLSHELRTPLTPVLMTAAALKDDPQLPGEIQEQLGMMERNIALEARLIDDLLDLTAISHGKLKLRLERCHLNALVKRAMEMVAQDSTAKHLAITCEFSAAQHVLMADITRLQQVVWNLLRNAVKFTPPNGKIFIRTRDVLHPDGNTWLALEIADTGIGIESMHLAHIFQPFDQGAHTGNHRFGGLGLGLAIAQAVVTAHGGRIHAQSEGVDRGAIFVVELPCVPAASLTPHAPSSPPRPPAKIAPLRLLLVEDHENTLQTLARFLHRDGHRVTTASTIASARAAAAQNTFDLVISDLGLPDGSGTQLMDHLRTAHGLRGIALSGYGMQEDIARSREAGFVAHLVKPIAISDLRRAIEDISRA